MYIKTISKFWAIFTCVALTSVLMIPSASAAEPSLWDRVKTTGSDIYQSAKDAAPDIIDQGKDLASAAADKAGELYQSAKDQAPAVIESAKEGLANASQQFSDFRQNQQDQFWDWFDHQTGSTSTSSGTTPLDAYAYDGIYYHAPEDNTSSPIESTENQAAPEDDIPSDQSSTLPSGTYTVDGQTYYYNAETGTLSPMLPANDVSPDTASDLQTPSDPTSQIFDTTTVTSQQNTENNSSSPWLALSFIIFFVMLIIVVVVWCIARIQHQDDEERAKQSARYDEAYKLGFRHGRSRRY